MGLLFKKTSASGNVLNKKRIPGSGITAREIREIGRQIASEHNLNAGARNKIERGLMEERAGGLEEKEFHKILQEEIIGRGYASKETAGKIAREVGMTEKSYRTFKDRSEFHAEQARKNKLSLNLNINPNPTGHHEDTSPNASPDKKHSSVWEILNEKSRPENFQKNEGENLKKAA